MWAKFCGASCVASDAVLGGQGTPQRPEASHNCAQRGRKLVAFENTALAMTDYLHQALPELVVLERGWLSSNNMVFVAEQGTALVDSGYCTHAAQTLDLVRAALGGRTLDMLVNTHLHSDHCGGNAALQAAYPQLVTHIPPGHAQAVSTWDTDTLTYAATGQECPRFEFAHTLVPGTELVLGSRAWQVHAAPGHDPHSIVLFEPQSRVLISADALWENGFGVVFPELEGIAAFDEVGATLTLIENLKPQIIIPGHGAVFNDVARALVTARQRLDAFVQNPLKHASHAAKVLIKFKLLEQQQMSEAQLQTWARATPYVRTLHATHFSELALPDWVTSLCKELQRVGAAHVNETMVYNA
jgi:glyoxylase-like metal-dependent hydrolase (beta-lactamase superfamily II)